MKRKLFMHFTEEEKSSWILFIAVFLTYSMVSMARNGYAASIASVTSEGLFSKSQAGTINAGFYIFYGAAQLLGIRFLDRVSPITFITISILGTIVSCVGMALSTTFGAMLFFWSICGLLQFAIWPSVMRIIAEYMLPEHRNQSMIYISFAFCAGSLMCYLLAAVVLKFTRWMAIFWILTVILIITAALWLYLSKRTIAVLEKAKPLVENIENEKKEAVCRENANYKKLLMSSGVIFLLFVAFFRSMLDLGIKSWVPTMMSEVYANVSHSFASVLTTFLLVINLSGVFYASWVYPKKIKNATTAFASCFIVAVPFVVMLLMIGKINIIWIVVLLTTVTTMMYAAHQFIDIIIPASFARYNSTGSISALSTGMGAFGSIVANIAYGFLADNFGWNATILSWVVMTIAAIIFCMCAVPFWKKFTQNEH